MKNLKKVLALGLALVMLMGMFTVVSAAETKKAASSLTDWDSIAHQDAVSLMVDLGIIKGMPDGSFDPMGNIDRASWAKMVYFAATGSEDADAYADVETGLKDIDKSWAVSYIKYLKTNDYISGDTEGNYMPEKTVTVAEACKMMLTVLGYNAEHRRYQNTTAWAANVINDAKRNGLLDNVDSNMTAMVPLTRENAAEIVLNALNANKVDSDVQWDMGVEHTTGYNKLYTLGYDVFRMVKVVATVDTIDENGMANFSTIVEPTPWMGNAAFLNGKVSATPKMIGENVNVYIKAEGTDWDPKTGEMNKQGTFQGVLSSAAAPAGTVADRVFTGGISRWGDITKRGTSYYVADNWATRKNDDGTTSKATIFYKNGNTATEDEVQTSATKRGTVVEFYTNDDGDISVVKAFEYSVGMVENGDASSKAQADGTVQVRVPGVLSSWVNSDRVSGWQGLVDGDVVLYYKTTLDGNVDAYTIEKADKVSGKVSSWNDKGELTIGGKSYRVSEQDMTKAGSIGDVKCDQLTFESWDNREDEFDFYLDKNGSICYIKQITESMDASKVCLVLETEVADSGLGVSGNLRANLLFVDGSTEIVNVSKVGVNEGGKIVTKSVVDKVTDATRQIKTDAAQQEIAGKKDATALTKFFTYRVSSTGYELTELNKANYPRNWETAVSKSGSDTVASIKKESKFAKNPINKGDTTTTVLSGWNVTANDATTFIVGKSNTNDDKINYSVYKGFSNVPEMDVSCVTAICAHTSTKDADVNTVAKFVYLQTGQFKDDVPEGYIFVTSNSWSIDPELEDTYVVNVVDTDGTRTTMRVDATLKDAIASDKMNIKDYDSNVYVGKFCEVLAINEDGVVSDLEPVQGLQNVTAMGGSVVEMGNNDSVDYDKATKFIYVDMGWADSETNSNSVTNVREVIDDMKIVEAGNFNPENFFNENDVDPTVKTVEDNANAQISETGVTYKSVQAVVVTPYNETTADYVYVVRVLW